MDQGHLIVLTAVKNLRPRENLCQIVNTAEAVVSPASSSVSKLLSEYNDRFIISCYH